MKLRRLTDQGFTLIEMLLAVSISSLILAATIATSVCLQRSLGAVENYFSAHLQQVRIIDYLSRDVKRSYIVTASTDRQTITCILPNYLVKAGDPDDTGSNRGTRRTPMLSMVGNKIVANYQATTVNNVTTSQGSTTLTCASFLPPLIPGFPSTTSVGQSVIGTGIPAGTIIQSVSTCLAGSCKQATISSAVTANNSSATVTIGSLTNVVYSVVNQAIQRKENGILTNIAASADNLIPESTDTELTNTEFTLSTVTFLPVFASGDQTFISRERAGTTIFSLTYLRNKRRGDG
jgi:prepilin-type N-terminal cleavage/methylation domain-containing protein